MAIDAGTDELETAGGEHNRLKTLGKYRIQKRIGAGGMGTVFLALDDSLNRTVALKVLPKDRAENPVLVRRFKAEGQAAAHMEHPNIVRVFEAGEVDGFLYIALEYIEGIDVHDLVERRGVIPVKRSTDIIRQTALALQHAYEKGIVHRDIKPSNLLIRRDGVVKLADMGLARSVDDTLETNITRAGTTVGTVDYMSPEQARNSKSTDVRSDIYSLGCTWFHMLTGHPPFPDGSMTNKLQSHAVSVRPDPRADNPGIPEGIVAIIQRMMACKPDDRHQTPQELLDDLEAAGRMKRTVDESALAALANDSDDPDSWDADEEVDEPVLRISEEGSDFDLSSLKDSGEYRTEAASAPSRPDKQQPKREKRNSRQRPSRAAEPDSAETPAEDRWRPKPTKGGSTPTVPERPVVRSPAGRPDSAAESDPEVPAKRASTRKPEKPKPPSKTAPPQRRPKRGSVTTTRGEAPALPAKDAAIPMDASAKKSINLDALKYIIPAVLVVGALVGIGYAIFQGGDAIGISGGANPYAGDQPDGGPSPAPVPPEVISNRGPAADASVPDERDPSPKVTAVQFPGAEDVSDSSEEKPLIPNWVNAFRNPSRRAERSLVVRRRPVGDGDLGSINDAFRNLPSAGGTIEIDGDGPFALNADQIANVSRVRLQAADGRRPVIQLRPADDWTSGPLLRFVKTQLELEGLHFVLADAGPAGASLIEVVDGNVSLLNCSITVDQRQPEDLTALDITGTAGRLGVDATGKCLLENVVIRGGNLTSIELNGPSTDLVVGNSLLVSGDAPTVTINDAGPGVTMRGIDPPQRGVRLLATTALSAGPVAEFVHQPDSGDVVPTDLIVRGSVLAAPAEAGEADGNVGMIHFHAWPIGAGGLGESVLPGFSCRIDQSSFLGWDDLVRVFGSDGEPTAQVAASRDEWRKFWKQGLQTDAIKAESVPAGPVSTITPGKVHMDIANIVKPLKGGESPGCRPEESPPMPTGLIDHVIAATRRPYEPEWLGQGMPIAGDLIRFDLGSRRSLSRFLSSDACADGTHVVAFGSGLKELDPIVIENKSVRLEFEAAGNSPLILQPSPARDGASREGFLIVRNGTLDLVNAQLRIPTSQSQAYPSSAILLEGSSLALRHCHLEGPRLESGQNAPLIRCTSGTDRPDEQSLLIENSFLVGVTQLIAGPVQWQSMIVRNSVLATESDAVSIVVTTTAQLPAAIVLDHSTIAASGVAIRADVDAAANANGDSLTVFCRACVFAGPAGGDGRQSAVMAHPAGASQNHSIVWWGSANGYSNRLLGFRIDGSSVPGDFPKDWLDGWGEGHEANPLTGAADVLFAAPVPDIRLVAPETFALADSATATTWGPAQEPIGAPLESVGPRESKPDSPGATKGSTPSSPNVRPGNRDPGF